MQHKEQEELLGIQKFQLDN